MAAAKKKVYPIRSETMSVWEDRLLRFAESELSLAEFCTAEEISRSSLLAWRSRLVPNYQASLEDYWRRQQQLYQQSGASKAEFCRQQNLSPSAFHESIKKLSRQDGNEVTSKKQSKSSQRPFARPARVPKSVVQKLIQKAIPRPLPKPETIKAWHARLTRFHASDLSVEEFSEQEKLAPGYVRHWRTQLAPYFSDGKPLEIDFENIKFGEVASNQKKREQWLEILRIFATSGQTATAFCEERGLHRSNFFAWQRRLKKSNRDIPASTRQLGMQRASVAQWLDVVHRFELSDLSIRDFVEINPDIKKTSFAVWKRRLAPYIVRNELGLLHEIEIAAPKLATAELCEKLRGLWRIRKLICPSLKSKDRGAFSYYFWASELGFDLGDHQAPAELDPSSSREEIENSLAASQDEPESDSLDATQFSEIPSTESKSDEASSISAKPDNSGVETDIASIDEEKGVDDDLAIVVQPCASQVEPSPDTGQQRSESSISVAQSGNEICVSVTMPDGAQIHLPKNLAAIDAIVNRIMASL